MRIFWLSLCLSACVNLPAMAADRVVNVGGQGEVRAEPDRALVSLGASLGRLLCLHPARRRL